MDALVNHSGEENDRDPKKVWAATSRKAKVITFVLFAACCAACVFVWNLPGFIPNETLAGVALGGAAVLTAAVAVAAAKRVRKVSVLIGLLVLYLWLASLIVTVPRVLLTYMNYPVAKMPATVDMIDPTSRACYGESLVIFREYQSFWYTLCTPNNPVSRPKVGDMLTLEGKKGLGGFLVVRAY